MTATVSNRLHLIRQALASGADPVCVRYMGDSFGMGLAARLPLALCMRLALPGFIGSFWAPYTSTLSTGISLPFFAGAATASHPYGSSSQGKHDISGNNLNFRQDGASPAAGDQWMGYPVGGCYEWYLDANYTPGGGSLNRISYLRLGFADNVALGVKGRPFTSGDTVKWRPFYYMYEDADDFVDGYELTDTNYVGTPVAFDPKAASLGRYGLGLSHVAGVPIEGQVNASASELTLANTLTGKPDVGCLHTGGVDKWLNFLGGMVRCTAGSRADGSRVVINSAESWALQGHALDAASSIGTPKRYSTVRLRDMVDLTSDDRNMRDVFAMSIAHEDLTASEAAALYQAWIGRCRQACAAVGKPQPLFLLIGHPVHSVGALSAANSTLAVQAAHAAMLEVSKANADTAYVGLGAYSEYNRFWATATAGAEAWLDANGGANFDYTGGARDFTTNGGCTSGAAFDLFDSSDLHIAGAPEAEFWAEKINELVQSSAVPAKTRRARGRLRR